MAAASSSADGPAQKATAQVLLHGFPPWTEVDDLRAVIDGCGSPAIDVRLQYKAEQGAMVAIGLFASLYEASAVAAQLNGFEFTPGYPLEAKGENIPEEELRKLEEQAQRAQYVLHTRGAKGASKGHKQEIRGFKREEEPATKKRGKSEGLSAEYPVSNCVGAGRIEGWFVTTPEKVADKGFGHLQSFSFEGNLVFHVDWSPLIAQAQFKQRDPVMFEVVLAKNGDYEAVNLALPEQEHQAPTPGEDGPWTKLEEPQLPEPPAASASKGKGKDRDKGKGKGGAGGSSAPAPPPNGNPMMTNPMMSSGGGGGGWGGWGGMQGMQMQAPGWGGWGGNQWGGWGWQGVDNRPPEERARDRVKQLQKSDVIGKEQWILYTERHGQGGKRDPKFYDAEFIENFFKGYDNGILLEGKADEYEEAADGSWAPPGKRGPRGNRDNTWGNEDGTGVFFGGLLKDVTEDALMAFAETVGPVKFIKIFTDADGKPRSCGKAFYESADSAEKAIDQLNGLQLCGKKVTVELLGQEPESRKRRRLAKQGMLTEEGTTEEGPKLLPLSFFSETDTIEAKMDLCYAAFEDLLVTHDPVSTGKGVVWMVRGILREINDVLADNVEAKQAFCMRLKRHPWFEENQQIVRWQESKKRIHISKCSPLGDAWREWNRQQYQIQREAEKAQGFGGLFAGAYVNLEDANKGPERPAAWGGGASGGDGRDDRRRGL